MTSISKGKFKPLLLATAALLFLAVPSVSFAQRGDNDRGDRGDRGGRQERQDRGDRGDRGGGRGPQQQAQPQAQPQQAQPQPAPQQRAERPQFDRGDRGGRFDGGNRGGFDRGQRQAQQAQPQPQPQPAPQQRAEAPRRDFGGRDFGGGGFNRGDSGRGDSGGGRDRGQSQNVAQEQRRDFGPSDRGRNFNGPDRQGGRPDFRDNRNDNRGGDFRNNRGGGQARGFQGRRPPEFHAQARNNWRADNGNWVGRTVWRRDPNWWRGNPIFRDYRGPRVNFFFAPGYGYYNVPAAYYGQRWNVGDYLPEFFLNYEVVDYQAYGLPPPPDGCAWVWVNNDVLLVDAYDGYIMDQISNVW